MTICLISIHSFECQAPTFYQYVLGFVSVYNFVKPFPDILKNLSDMKTLGSILRWTISILGGVRGEMNVIEGQVAISIEC